MLIEHARRELLLRKESRLKPYDQILLDAVEVFSGYGHSGGSAMYTIHALDNVLNHGSKLLVSNESEYSKHLQDIEKIINSANYIDEEVEADIKSDLIRLLNYKPITPLTGEDAEWFFDKDIIDNKTYQNIRCFSVFKDGKDGTPHDIDALFALDENDDKVSVTKDIVFPYDAPVFPQSMLPSECDEIEEFEYDDEQ